ncbi:MULTISPECIES: hypothetical protein [unclassified Shewanella]|uniref:hypothetical protein n=1 Tax=unclassified Shewanella TaxID=196818 RepID=UPI00354FE9E0
MNKLKTSRVIIAIPFFIIGTGSVVSAFWLVIGRLLEGMMWKEDDSFVIGAMVVLILFGSSFISFGKDALYKGHSKKSKRLIGPTIFYAIGVIILIPGVWSFFAGSQQALIISLLGIASIIYGLRLSHKVKKEKVKIISNEV